MSNLGSKKIGKTKYPDKTSINLAMAGRDKGENKLPVLFFVVFLIVLLVFVKFMVIDKLSEAYQVKQEYQQMEGLIGQLKDGNKDYSKIKAEYSHYGNGYLNDDERAEQDRLKIINLISNKILPQARVSSLQISGNVATLTIDNTRLSVVSEVVSTLEDDKIVDYVNMNTAGTRGGDSSGVTATMVINFKSLGGEQ